MSGRGAKPEATSRTRADPRASAAPPLRVQLTKRVGGGVLNCIRADGTVTWQTQDGPPGLFFPYHDLTHYAVEIVLGFRHAFYGLLADGWTIDDTGGKGVRARIRDLYRDWKAVAPGGTLELPFGSTTDGSSGPA